MDDCEACGAPTPRDTLAIRRGEVVARMCSWCGCYIEVEETKLHKLGPCPACGHTGWWTTFGGRWREDGRRDETEEVEEQGELL